MDHGAGYAHHEHRLSHVPLLTHCRSSQHYRRARQVQQTRTALENCSAEFRRDVKTSAAKPDNDRDTHKLDQFCFGLLEDLLALATRL